jgi:pyruvate dehydrogenase E2 component (dihydrolipoamide acetyltransferase)
VNKLRAFMMPKWGIEMTEGKINEWNVREGDAVKKGQIIAQIETDKIVNEVEAEVDAQVVRLVAAVGETYPVGALLGVFASEPTSIAEIEVFMRGFQTAGVEVLSGQPSNATGGGATESVKGAQRQIDEAYLISPAARDLVKRLGLNVSHIRGSGRKGRISLQDVAQAAKPPRIVAAGSEISVLPTTAILDAFYASPFAKRLAVQHDVDLSKLAGTGPRGRVSKQDVLEAAGIRPANRHEPGAEVVRMTPMRKAIARQLTLSNSTIPHFKLRLEINLDDLLTLRTQVKARSGTAPHLNDYFIRACALALLRVPDMNIQVHGEDIHRFRHAAIAVAVATDRGLIAPVLHSADSKSVSEIAAELLGLIDRARAGKLRQQEIDGASFTVSNLGMYGIEQFDAIISPPQGAILAIGAARRRAIEVDGKLAFGNLAWFSLSCDHRAIDGAVGAKFLGAIKELIESPQQL